MLPALVTSTHTLMGARLVKVFVINLEKDKFLCYMQKIATVFEVDMSHKVKFFQFWWSHQHTQSGCECATNKAYIDH